MDSEQRRALLQRRDELRARLQRIRDDLGGGLEADSEERAQQLENRDALLEIARVTEEELQGVLRELESEREE